MASGDGGPAFPVSWSEQVDRDTYEAVVAKGMSLRTWLAGRAMQALVRPVDIVNLPGERAAELARDACLLADAMLEVLEQPSRTRMLFEILYEACKADMQSRSGDCGAALEKAWPLVCEALGRPTKPTDW